MTKLDTDVMTASDLDSAKWFEIGHDWELDPGMIRIACRACMNDIAGFMEGVISSDVMITKDGGSLCYWCEAVVNGFTLDRQYIARIRFNLTRAVALDSGEHMPHGREIYWLDESGYTMA